MPPSVYVPIAAFAVTLSSGIGAIYLRRHKALVLGFCAGALTGSAVILLLPDARELLLTTSSGLPPDLVWLACALGFLFFYLFARGGDALGSTRLAGLGGAIGLAIHSFFDGVVIGQGFQAGEEVGVSLAVAVLVHKLADGVSAVGIMLGTRHSLRETTAWLLVTAIAPVAGAVAQSLVVLPSSLLALLLAWFAGMFLYLGANRLLPEARRESPSRAVPALTIGAVALIYVVDVFSH